MTKFSTGLLLPGAIVLVVAALISGGNKQPKVSPAPSLEKSAKPKKYIVAAMESCVVSPDDCLAVLREDDRERAARFKTELDDITHKVEDATGSDKLQLEGRREALKQLVVFSKQLDSNYEQALNNGPAASP